MPPIIRQMLYLSSLSLVLTSQAWSDSIYRCIDERGKPFFTDKKHLCKDSKQNNDAIDVIDPKLENLHSQYGKFVSEEYYNYGYRNIQPYYGTDLPIHIESALLEKSPKLAKNAARKLTSSIHAAINTFPARIHPEFDDLHYYIFTGDESETGGRKGGQWYISKYSKLPKKFHHSIVVRSASIYMQRYTKLRAQQTAVHELSHAYYYKHWKRIYKSVKAAYENAKNQKLYLNVKHQNGGIVKKAYALKNDKEYFAELSKIFFIGSTHYPFNASQLKKYDPEGYKMVMTAFYY